MNRDIIILCAMMCIAVIFASCGSDSEPVPGENEGQNVEEANLQIESFRSSVETCGIGADYVANTFTWSSAPGYSPDEVTYAVKLECIGRTLSHTPIDIGAATSYELTNRCIANVLRNNNLRGRVTLQMKFVVLVKMKSTGKTVGRSQCQFEVANYDDTEVRIPQNFSIRDPFVTVDRENRCYYIITAARVSNLHYGLRAYKSYNLDTWFDKGLVYDASNDVLSVVNPSNGDSNWAPDTYCVNGAYYTLFTVSVNSMNIPRFTTAVRSDNGILGPYRPIANSLEGMSVTPVGEQCIDGSLFVDTDGSVWTVFTKEWNGPQVTNQVGETWAQQLSADLTEKIGEPVYLFKASDASWGHGTVVDSPFIWRDAESGCLLMLWSSFSRLSGNYAIGQLTSTSGKVEGPWVQVSVPVYDNGGHQMLFYDLDGNLKMSFHYNNNDAHLRIVDVKIVDGKVQLK